MEKLFYSPCTSHHCPAIHYRHGEQLSLTEATISTILCKVSSSRKVSHKDKLVAVTGNNNFSSIIGE